MIPSRKFLIVAAVAVVSVLLAGPVAADWNAGVDLYNQGRFAEAADHFRAVARSNPEWPGAYLMLGRCQLALEQHGDAIDNLRKAAELAPGDPANAASLSRALVALDRSGEALELLEGLELDTLSPAWKVEFSRMRARCLLAEDRPDDAVAVLLECLEDNQDNAAVHRAIAAAYQAVGDRSAVLHHLARAFSLDPVDQSSGRAAVKLALALAAAAPTDELAADYHTRAGELATELMTAAPGYENALLAGDAAGAAEHLPEAANWYAAAVKERPQEPVARYRFACTLAALERSDEAVDQLRAALGAAPDAGLAAHIHGRLGRLLACRLELREAARHYRAAGDDEHAARIDELAASFSEALVRLAGLRSDAAELAGMEAELEKLGDADGVTAVADRRKAMGQEIAAIEDNLAAVRAALCQ